MRIIGGKHKGRRFTPPRNNPARPTTDFAKEALFNILNNYFEFESIRFLDLFAGTGSLSFEFASRGCADITAVELHPPNCRFIEKTAAELALPIQVIRTDVFSFIAGAHQQWEVIFAGPPYPLENLDTLPDEVLNHDLLTQNGWFILEHSPRHQFDDHPHFASNRHYGQTNFSIFTS